MKRPSATCSRSHRDGFVLLLTVGLLLIVVITTGRLAQSSLRFALEANRAQTDLQDRWARITLQKAVLNRGRVLLVDQSRNNRNPESSLDAAILLGGQTYRLRLADERAKINLNLVEKGSGQAEVARVVRRHAAKSGLHVRLRPGRMEDSPEAPAFESWGQVFDLGLQGRPEQLLIATEVLTCWGSQRTELERRDGSVNVQSADERGESDEGTKLRDAAAALGNPDSSPIASSCYSLWILNENGRGQFSVSEVSRDRTDVVSFLW